MGNINKEILDGTLSNDASVAELLRQQESFDPDNELSPDLQARGRGLFNTALFTDTPAALKEGKAVVTVLRRTIEAIGTLYLEHNRRQAIDHESNNSGGKATDSIEVETEPTEQNATAATNSAQPRDIEEADQSPRVQAVIAARRKRREMTHGRAPRRGMSAAAGVLKALKRPTHTKNTILVSPNRSNDKHGATTTEALQKPKTSSVTDRKTRSKDAEREPDIAQTRPSLILKLHLPTMYAKPIMAKKKSTKHARRVKIKSEEFVTSDIEDGATGDNEELAVPGDTEDITMPDAPELQGKRAKRATIASSAKPSNKVSDSPRITRSEDRNSTSWESASSASSSTSSSLSGPPSNLATLAKRSFTSITSPKFPSSKCAYVFPAFPNIPTKRRANFHLGATIAMENLIEDHAAYPGETFLELIEDLEDNKPTFTSDDWEHRTILKGGTWVCDVLRIVAGYGPKPKPKKCEEEPNKRGEVDVEVVKSEEAIGIEEGKKDELVEEVVKEEVDVVGLVKELEKWVEKEWERVKPMEKTVSEVDEDDTDDCGCGSPTPEAEEPERKRRK